jgi:hypothetical protein
VLPNTHTYSILSYMTESSLLPPGCSTGNCSHWAWSVGKVYRRLVERQVLPNTNTYSILLKGCSAAKEEPDCIYDAMK